MEILTSLFAQQEALEDVLRLETTPEEVNNTELGKKIFKYLRKRRRFLENFSKTLSKLDARYN